MVLGPENGEQEAEEKHHQAKTNQADNWNETHTHRLHHKLLVRRYPKTNYTTKLETEATVHTQYQNETLGSSHSTIRNYNMISKTKVTLSTLKFPYLSNFLQVLQTP